jgi:hypothetical protein
MLCVVFPRDFLASLARLAIAYRVPARVSIFAFRKSWFLLPPRRNHDSLVLLVFP